MELIVRTESGREETVELEHAGAQGYRIRIGGAIYEIDAQHVHAGDHRQLSLLIDGEQHEIAVDSETNGQYRVRERGSAEVAVEVMDPLTHLARQAHAGAETGGRVVEAYMPGRIAELLVAEGDRVEEGQGILVLEAMKMKNEIQSEVAGIVARLFVAADQPVEGGEPLFEIGLELTEDS